MEKFGEFFGNSQKTQVADQTFCYMLYPNDASINKLMVLQDKIKNKYPTCGVPIKPKDLHCTVRGIDYGFGQSPKQFVDWAEEAYLPKFVAFIGNLDIFGEFLVAKLNSDDLNNWFAKIDARVKSFGYKDDKWRIFRPHISLFKNPAVDELEPFTTYKFRIDLPIHKITDASEKVIFEKNSTS